MEIASVKLKKLPVANLIPYANNARTHDEKQIKQIASSIKEFGFNDWRFCVENDCYAVTCSGEVLRVCRRQFSKSGKIINKYEVKLLLGSIDKYGYKTYRIRENGKKKHLKGHRLILNAYRGINPLKSANHKNGIKTDNNLGNLEWVTVAENNRHAIKEGLLVPKKGINQKIHTSNYISIYLMIKHLRVPRLEIAKANNVSRQTIDRIYGLTNKLFSNKELLA